MRELIFNVNGQILEKDQNCDFNNIVSGTEGYLKVKVNFDKNWNNFGKVAVFKTILSDTEIGKILKDDVCEIPKEVLGGSKFYMKVMGLRNGTKLTTNMISVEQNN
jgi:hypothetical protein